MRRTRGRPRGETTQGKETRGRIYAAALRLVASNGFQATTLRAIATEAAVSPGLLYRYFPSKQAVVLAFYDELSAAFAQRAEDLPHGPWSERFRFALRESLATLAPHRAVLRALNPILMSGGRDGLFGSNTEFARKRVQSIFERAVLEASNRPRDARTAQALGRFLYLLHLTVLLLWTLDKSPDQSASLSMASLVERSLRWARVALKVPGVRSLLREADRLLLQALFRDGQV
ncbi:MAG: TetR/AcrR family transcriptional regulator [Planctomycetota bacterium]|jgi:AcrR family transcriptional regulator